LLEINKIHNLNCIDGLKKLNDKSVNCCVTSPPYWGLRDYGIGATLWPTVEYSPMAGLPNITIPEWEGCLGLEPEPYMFIGHIVYIFREVYRVLKNDGTLWVNLGDSYVGNARHEEGFNERWHGKHYLSDKQGETSRLRPKRKLPNNLKPKNLIGIPWMAAYALQADGWYLRSDIIWNKPNAMPESVKDRPTRAHEYIFLLSKSGDYYYDSEAIKEPCVNGDPNPPRGSMGGLGNMNSGRRLKGNRKTFRGGGTYTNGQSFDNSICVEPNSKGNKPNDLMTRNKRDVWNVSTTQFKKAHFATFPPKLIEPCILAGCPKDGITMDIFMGSGTVGMKALELQRNYIGFEMNPNYIKIAENDRIKDVQLKIV
jgi:DNA modification methylase